MHWITPLTFFAFKEIAIIHPSNFECFTDGYEFFAIYCSNKLPGMNMTCQQIGAQKKYNSKLSPIQKAHTNALKNRNKWYPSKKSGLRTPEQTREYENWKKRTSEIRDTFLKKYNNAHTDMQREKYWKSLSKI